MKTITATRHYAQTWLDYSHNYPKLVVITLPREYIQSLEGINIPVLEKSDRQNGIIKNSKHIITAGSSKVSLPILYMLLDSFIFHWQTKSMLLRNFLLLKKKNYSRLSHLP